MRYNLRPRRPQQLASNLSPPVNTYKHDQQHTSCDAGNSREQEQRKDRQLESLPPPQHKDDPDDTTFTRPHILYGWQPLTKRNLALLNNMNGLQGSNQSSSTTTVKSDYDPAYEPKTTTSAANHGQLQLLAAENFLLNPRNSDPPSNREALLQRLGVSQPSLDGSDLSPPFDQDDLLRRLRRVLIPDASDSTLNLGKPSMELLVDLLEEIPVPSQATYFRFKQGVFDVWGEAGISHHISTCLLKPRPDSSAYTADWDVPFSQFPKSLSFNRGFKTPQPDYIEGFKASEFARHGRRMRYDIPGAIPNNTNCIAFAHFAGEFKAQNISVQGAEQQTALIGASLVYARNRALKYLRERGSRMTDEEGSEAKVLTFASNGENFHIFAHHATEEDGCVKYHQTTLVSLHPLDSYQAFSHACKVVRNAQTFAEENSLALKKDLLEYWGRQNQTVEVPVPTADSGEKADTPVTQNSVARQDERGQRRGNKKRQAKSSGSARRNNTAKKARK
ncbi:hypothetical protein BGZ63DRAFT_434734 [Mariannaea sp. PMI_226]|nr:hypothetical protein BGZ63DRAFT_434734 [Mariannaea sp. PMI_226]